MSMNFFQNRKNESAYCIGLRRKTKDWNVSKNHLLKTSVIAVCIYPETLFLDLAVKNGG